MLYEIRLSHYSACTLSSAVWYHAACKKLVLNTVAYPPHHTWPLVIYRHTHTHIYNNNNNNNNNNTYGTVCLVRRRTSFHDKKERSIQTKNSSICQIHSL
jgi:hypothetical protein